MKHRGTLNTISFIKYPYSFIRYLFSYMKIQPLIWKYNLIKSNHLIDKKDIKIANKFIKQILWNLSTISRYELKYIKSFQLYTH